MTGTRHFKLPVNWTPAAPLSLQDGEYLLDYQGGAPVQVVLHQAPSEPVSAGANAFAERLVLETVRVQALAFSSAASKEIGEANHAGFRGGKSVWWSWTAPANGVEKISTRGSDFDTLLAVYSGAEVASLTPVIHNDDAAGDTTAAEVTFDADAGTTYHIAVDGFDGAAGIVALDLVCRRESLRFGDDIGRKLRSPADPGNLDRLSWWIAVAVCQIEL